MSRLSNDRDGSDRKQAGDAEALSFEQSQAELEKLIGQIESGQLGLEESIAAYERGQQLLNRARGILSKAEQTFTDLTAKANQAANQASGEGA